MDDKLTLFYNSLTANPAITGLPEDIGTFKTALSDPARSEVFYNSLKANPNIKGLPDNYKDFLSGLSIKAGGVTPQQPKQPFLEGLGRKGGVSALSLGEMVTEIPQAVEAVANIPMNIFAGAMIKKAERKGELDKETADFLREEQLYPKANFGQILPSAPGQESMGQALADSKLNEWFESNAEKLNKTVTRYDQTATQYLKNMQFGNALGVISYGVAESIAPTLAAMLVPGGAAALGLGVGAQKYDEVKDREDMSEAMKLADSATSAIFEWLFEKFGSAEMAKYLKSYYNKVGGKGLQQAFGSQTMQNLIGKAYKKLGLWFAPVHEGVSEFATQIGQDLASKLSGESPDLTFQDIKANAIEAFLIGTGMGGFFSSTTALAKKVRDTVSPPSPLDTGTEPGAIGPLQVPRTQQEVEQIINEYGRNIKFGETPLEEDPDPMVSFAQTKLGQKVVLKQEAGLSGDKFFIAIDTETKQPLFIKPADIVERKDVPYQQWFNDEMNNYLIVKDEADNVTAQIEAPVKEGQDITLKDRNFFVSQVTAGGVTLNEIDEKGNITEGELIVPPEDYGKVFGVPAVDNGGVSQENVTEQGLQPQNIVTEQGQSTSVDNTLIPQLPVNKKGEIEYDQITEPDMYAQGLTQEFGEDAPAIVDELIAEQNEALKKAKKASSAIERARKVKAINTELAKLAQVRDIINPQTEVKEEPGYDSENIQGLPGEVGGRQELEQAQPDEETGRGEIETGGILQAKGEEEITQPSKEAQLIKAETEVDTRPTEAQKEAGNYKKGHISIEGMEISIENPAGSIRKGKDKTGKEWSVMLNNSYGYFRRSKDKDGDQIDVFLGDNLTPESVYIIDQVDPETGQFDEHKVMLGFDSAQSARENYLANYEPGWKGLGAITKMSIADFKKWLGDGTRTRKPVAPELIKEETFPKSRLSPIDKMLNMTGQEIVNEWEELVYPIDLLSEQNKKQALELQKQKKATRKKDERAKFDEKIKQLQNETHKAYDDLENEYGERNEQLWQWIKSEIKRRGISIPEETEDEDYYFFSELMNDIFERPGREVTWYMKFKDVFDEQFNGWVENKIFASLKPKAEEKAKPEEAIEPKAEQAPAAPETRDLTGFRKGDLVKNVQTEMIYEIIAPAKDGKVHLKVKGGKEIIKFSAKRKLFVPVQKEIKVRKKRKGPVAFKPDSPYGRALDKTAESFEEAVMQFLIGGGKLWTKDVIAYVTGKNNPKELRNYIGMYANDGIHMDVLHEHLPNSFGIEDKGAMDEINAIVEVMDHYRTKKAMVKELLRRIDQPFEQELAPEYVIEQMEEPTVENVESYIPEAVDNVLEEILSNKETMSIFTSRSHEDENGNIDWKQLKDLAETDSEYFTGGFPFALNENEFNNFKTLLNDAERQRSIEEEISKYPRFESGGEGDILWPGTPGDEKGDRPAAEEPSEEPSEPEVKKLATEEKKPEFIGEYLENKKVAWSAPAVGIIQSATTDDIAYPPENKSGTGKVSGNSPQTTSLEDKDTKKEETSQAPEQKKTEFAGEYLEKKPEEKVLKEEKPKGPDYKTPKGQAELLKYLIDAENNLASNQKEIASLKDSESLSPVKRKELKQRELLQEQNQKRINDLKEQIDNDILPPEKQNEIRKLIQETNTRNAVVANRILRLQDERDTKEKSLQKRNTLLGDSKIEQEKQAGMQDLFGMEEVFQPKAENLQAALKPFNDGIKKAEEEIDRNNQLLDEKIDLVLKGTQEAIDWGIPPAEADEKAEAPKEENPDELKLEIVEVSKPSQKIEDFGEHISGAKKEIRGQLKKHLETTDEDLLNNSISKVLPPVDYKNLVDSGMATPQESAFLAYLRMGIGPKPKSQYKQAGWLRKVNAYKDALRWIIEKEEFMAAHEGQSMMELLEKSADVYLVKRMKDYISTLVELGFPNDVTSLKDYEIKHFEGGVRIDGRGGKIERPARWTIVKGHYIVQDFETREQAIAGLKYILTTENEAPRKVKFDVWKENGKKGLFVGKKVGPGKYITLASGFDKISEVRKYIENHQEELEKMLEQKKIIPYERPEERGPRIGKDYRKGENVTPELFSQTFGFRGVQFGNYVEQLKRQEDLNEAYDALMDLSEILGLPPMALSLSGQLGIAFGARGTGGKQAPSAHYEPDEIVINLTKSAGAGSLAHEWFHAVDNYFSRSRGEKFGYLIERPFQLINKDGTKSDLIRPEVIEAFKNVVNTIHGSGLRQRSKELDKRRTKDYWSQPIEMAARSFEAYVKAKLSEREVKNDYLVSFKDIVDYIIAAGGEEGVYPYPTKEESEKIFGAFDNLFSAIQTKEEDGRVVMYRTSRAGGTANNKPFQEFSDRDAIRAEKAAVKEFGTTDDWREVGYITFNGNKLDFSGKNDGGMPGERGYDHRQVNSALDGIDLGKYETDKYWQDSASNGMYAFLDMGNIRVSSSFGGLAMTKMPTTEQFREIRNFIRHCNGMISLDLNDTGVEYNKWTDEEQIINDIKRFYDEGIVPLPDFSAFRSTQPQGEALLESVIGGETPNYDRYLTDKITELGESFNTPITVVRNKYELPVRLQRHMQRYKVWNSRVTGLYDRQTGTIYVLLDDIKALGADKAMEEVTKTVLHEIVAHKGLPELLGEEEYERFLDDLYWDIPQDDRALLMYEYSTDDKKTIAEEYLGMMAEDNINPNLFQRVLAKIRQLLRRLFRVSYSENDIRDMLRRSQENLRRPQTKDYEFAGEYLEDSVKEERSGSFRARQRVKQSLLEQAAEAYSEKEKKRQLGETMQGIREYFQDLNLPIRRFEEEVIKRGGQQDNQSKPYRDLNLSFGRHEKLYNDFFDEKMKPVLDAIAQLKKAGVPGENILPYIICKHAIERNAVMRGHELREWTDSNKNATFEDTEAQKEALKDKDYSGVMGFDKDGSYTNPDELARDIVKEFESQVQNKKLIDNLWSTTKAATNTILDAWEDGLQISPERKKEYQEQYRFYVPLRGWREGAAKDLVYTKGEGFSKSLRHAEGRKSLADNPLAYIQQVAFQAIAEQIDNEVKTSMSNLIIRNLKNNEIHELATIKKLYYVKVHLPDGTHEWEPTTDRPSPELFESGEATQKIYRAHERLRAPRQAKEHEVYVHRPGGDLVMIFKGKNLPVAQALNKQNYIYRNVFGHYDARDINKAFMLMGHINNMLKAAYTSWNVVFPFTNFMRDFQEASITQAIKQGTGLKVIRNYKHAFPAIARHIAGRSDLKKPIDREMDDFYRLGGATGYTHLKTPEEIEKDINNEIKRMVREGTLRGDMQNSAITFLNAVEAWNRIFEDATRFAVYRASLAAGNTKEDAAIDAKEASVNFNRKGKGSKAWDAWFAFFNVALQSMQKNFSLAKHHTGRFSAVALSFITVGFIEAMMNALFDDDDDSSYYNINPYMRHNYLVIPNVISLIKGEGKGDKYLSIPLPQFWRGFKSMGAIGFDIATKRTKVIDGIMDALGNFGSSLLPVDIGGFWKSGEFSFAPIMPTVIKPIVEVAENKNYMGYAIMNEPFTRDQKKILANAGLGKKNVSPAAKFFTDMLFRWGGGDTKYKYYYDEAKGRHRKVPGVLDINPSAIEHLFKGYTGGTGAVFSDMITTISQAFDPEEEIDFRNTPFVNRFIRKTPEAKWNIIKEYYDLRDDSKVTNLLSKEYWKSGSYDKAMSILGDEYSMKYIQIIKHYESALDDAAKAMDYDTVEGSDLTIELMRQCIIDIRDLKEEHGKK